MERCVYKYVYNYLFSNSAISQHQSGFTKGDSTVNQLLDLSNTLGKALDDGKEIRMVFLDVSKAFDRVWHKGLLHKLQSYGIKGKLLLWFTDYLSCRKQRVVHLGTCSGWQGMLAGVPQGSILGPLLFLLYINDIVRDITANIRLFADDTTLYLIVDNPETASQLLNNSLQLIYDWSRKWLVSFNPQKTESMVISRKHNKITHPTLSLNNVDIIETNEHKHLGITFSSDGSWNQHVSNILSKASISLNILRKFKFHLSRNSLQNLYFAFIRPILEYADIVWDNLPINLQEELEKLNLEAARIVTGLTKLCSKQALYSETGWEPLSVRRKKHRLTQFHKMFYGLTKDYLSNLIPQRQYRTTRQSDQIPTILCHSQAHFQDFLPATIRDWNELPSSLRQTTSPSSFKALLNENQIKPPFYYNTGNRLSQILHARLRNNCAIRAHLYNKNLIDNPYCACGQIETTEHFLFIVTVIQTYVTDYYIRYHTHCLLIYYCLVTLHSSPNKI